MLLALWGTSAVDLSSFELSFDKAVRLLSYTVSTAESIEGGETFSIVATSGGTTEDMTFTVGQDRNFDNQITLAAGEAANVYYWSPEDSFSGDALYLGSLTVQQLPGVPLPAGVWLMLSGLAVLGLRARQG